MNAWNKWVIRLIFFILGARVDEFFFFIMCKLILKRHNPNNFCFSFRPIDQTTTTQQKTLKSFTLLVILFQRRKTKKKHHQISLCSWLFLFACRRYNLHIFVIFILFIVTCALKFHGRKHVIYHSFRLINLFIKSIISCHGLWLAESIF